ncbi:MAG: polysaccharide biosynthesis/export family protein [Sphingopyxis sp.]|nr:polysaccharide biosynthesis/export family protein [Sphingopyxis sp.]
MNRSFALTTTVAIAVLVAACAKDAVPVASVPGSSVTLLKEMPQPTAADFSSLARPSFIGPFDKLSIAIFGVKELDRDVQTDGEGKFAFPLVGTVDAAGKTTGEVAEVIRSRLDVRYVKRPQVTVNLLESRSQIFAVDGQVNKPGQYPLVGEGTLMRSIAAAGGTGEFAKLEDVLIFRRVGGQQYVGIYNLGAIRRGNYPDPQIFANDVIVVGDSPQRRMFKDILQAAPLLSTPIIVLGQQL